MVLAWIWLELALAAASVAATDGAFADGKRAAAGYFFRYELPKIGPWLAVVAARDATCRDLDPAAF